MGNRTPLYDRHAAMGARIVDFAGWEMPLHYGSQLKEHHAVRMECGVFDVSHMGLVDLAGDRTEAFLRHLLANDVARIPAEGQAQYGVMLNEKGGVIDDLITYRLEGKRRFRMVVNAGTRVKDVAWIRQHAEAFGVTVTERTDLAMLAVQGPECWERLGEVLPPEMEHRIQALKAFRFLQDGDLLVARTGYTGEDGVELMLPVHQAGWVWDRLVTAGATPVGLGARDTLRLEAGLNLYGSDMDETFTPMESGLCWTISWDPSERDFIGRRAIEPLRSSSPRKRIGLIVEGRGIPRDHQRVLVDGGEVGVITSGSYSPTLEAGIAMARVNASVTIGSTCQVDIRGNLLPARVVSPPFVRFGIPVHAVEQG